MTESERNRVKQICGFRHNGEKHSFHIGFYPVQAIGLRGCLFLFSFARSVPLLGGLARIEGIKKPLVRTF